mmetsp:Transcript_5772/g.21002  ORF Transcript_5772/g.21002 Transcript_5772/m.21002 type:complete len:153 (-) Transcript_5772:177-635(-)
MDRYEALESGPSTPTTQRSRRSSQARRSSGLSYSSAAESNGEGHDVDGLRALLEAEREAQAIVQRARQDREARFKAMQGDLQQEVQRFRAECEAHLQRRQQETIGLQVAQLEQQTEAAKQRVQASMTEYGAAVTQQLIDSCMLVDLRSPTQA